MICDDDFYAGKCPARKEDGTCISKFPCSHKVEPPKPPTNADCIRSMSDDELAEFLTDLADDGNLKIREWLQQPVEEDDYEQ